MVAAEYPSTAIVMMSCSMPSQQKIALKNKGAFDCLQKPIFKDTFLRVLGNIDESRDSLKSAA